MILENSLHQTHVTHSVECWMLKMQCHVCPQEAELKLNAERTLRDGAESHAVRLQGEVSQLSGKLAEEGEEHHQRLSEVQQQYDEAKAALSQFRQEANSLKQEAGMAQRSSAHLVTHIDIADSH